MTAPTEAEIRAALEARWNHPGDRNARDLVWIEYLSDGLRGDDVWQTDGGNGFGDDAMPTPRLAELLDAAQERIHERCRAIAMEEFIAAGLAFAAEYPDHLRGPDPSPEERSMARVGKPSREPTPA